jgi:hypothetical protein
MEPGMSSHHFLPLVEARAPSTHANTAHATLMGTRHSRYGGMKRLANRIALTIPVLVDLFTRHLLRPALAYSEVFECSFTDRGFIILASNERTVKTQIYLWRDFVFAFAITAKGGTTVTRTRAKTITKPNIELSLAFSDFSVRLHKHCAGRDRFTITRRRWVMPERLQSQAIWVSFGTSPKSIRQGPALNHDALAVFSTISTVPIRLAQ